MSVALAYITTANPEEAEKIGRLLVDKRLAACVNIVPGMRSLFWWQGALDHGEETILIAKTQQNLVEELTRVVIEAHSYDCPCVLALPVVGGNPEFIRWIREETRSSVEKS